MYTYFADETGKYMLQYTANRVVMWTFADARGSFRKLSEYGYLSGKIDGRMVIYHDDGLTRKEEHIYHNGVAHGKSYIYNPDGSLYADCVFRDGELNGYFRIWENVEKGVLSEKALCKNDHPVYKYWYDDQGRIEHEFYYDDSGHCVEEVEYARKNGHCYVARKSAGSYKEDIYL